jgi:S-adenosylmethionine hydrolase
MQLVTNYCINDIAVAQVQGVIHLIGGNIQIIRVIFIRDLLIIM